MIIWTPTVLSVLYACVLYFCICTCSAQLSMFHTERHCRNMLIYYYYYHCVMYCFTSCFAGNWRGSLPWWWEAGSGRGVRSVCHQYCRQRWHQQHWSCGCLGWYLLLFLSIWVTQWSISMSRSDDQALSCCLSVHPSCVAETLTLYIVNRLFNQVLSYLPRLQTPLTYTILYHF